MIAIIAAFSPAQSMAGQATIVSGDAAKTLLSTYRSLAATQSIPPLGTSASSLAITIRETSTEFSVRFTSSSNSGRSPSSDVARTFSVTRSLSLRPTFSDLVTGTKTLGPAPTSALLTVLDFASAHPAMSEVMRRYDATGSYVVDVFEPGYGNYIFVSMSYPGSSAAGKTAIGCNPQRQFRFDTLTNAVIEIPHPCS
jgi:hypothetical protein